VLSVLFPRNVPGFQTGGYPRSHYYDASQGNGTVHPTYGSTYLQAPVSPSRWVQPGIPVGYGTPQQPPVGPRPRSEYIPSYPVQSANEPYPPGVAGQQSPRLMATSWSSSHGSAAAYNALGGSYSPQLANESHSPYHSGGFNFQNPPSMTAAGPLSQHPAGIQNTLAASHSRQPASQSYPPHPPCDFVRQQNPRHMTTAWSPHQSHTGVGYASGESYRHRSVNESHSLHPPCGLVSRQNPPPMTAASPSRGPVGVQDALGPNT